MAVKIIIPRPELITPQQAREWLARTRKAVTDDEAPRPNADVLRDGLARHIATYAQWITEGKWVSEHPTPLLIDKRGVVWDGLLRLNAIIQADRAQAMRVHRVSPEEARAIYDTVLHPGPWWRSLSDVTGENT